ncbi:hypothetical protein HOLleu_05741 [Holothuria leucospilota]|uniref:Uncharacterized protein n=1 Tax=Holothuria leucospilota TaxID=206669 RepID=A0A9Q1HIG5_HOLLE|nr:hypothetical protein HOLleu_05741 [Holothuria leucospilota]
MTRKMALKSSQPSGRRTILRVHHSLKLEISAFPMESAEITFGKYSLNCFKQPTVSQSVDITVSVQTSKTETKHLGRIHLNSSHPLNFGHRGALKFIARLVTPHPLVDLGPSDPVIPIDDKLLLVPEVTSTMDLEHRQIKNGSLEYLVVNQTLFRFPKWKYWSNTNHYFRMGNPENHKYLETISQDQDKQPFDLWLQDRIQQLLGKPTKFFLSSYGTIATHQPKRRNAVSFLMDQDLLVEVTIVSSNGLFPSHHVQLTRHGILMTFLGTISDPYHLIVSVSNTVSVFMWTCKESLTSILSYLCKVLVHLLTVSSEFLLYYDDDTLKNEFWKAWDAITIICWSDSYGLHLLIILRILFACVIAIITWLLFIPKNHQNDLHMHTAVSCPSSADGNLVVEAVLPGVNDTPTNEHQNLAGANLVSSLSGTSISSDCSKDSLISCESSLCQHSLLLDDITPPDEDELQDNLQDDDELSPLFSRPPFHDDCLSESCEPFEVMSLSDEDDSTTLSEAADAYDADDEADDKTDDEPVQSEVAKKLPRNFHCEDLMMLWASDVCGQKGFFIDPHWRMVCSVPEALKETKHFAESRSGALTKLANSQTISDPKKIPNFGQWIFSGKVNPYWVFQNQWPLYTWSTSCYLPTITGTLMRGLPWKDVIYFPGGFITPCPAFNYRTESLAYLS